MNTGMLLADDCPSLNGYRIIDLTSTPDGFNLNSAVEE